MAGPARPRSRAILTLAASMAGMAALLHLPVATSGPLLDGARFHIAWLALGFLAAEACAVHIHVRRQAHSFSLTEIPLVLGIAFYAPTAVLAARMLGSVVALTAVRRQPVLKQAFNLSLFALETAFVTAVVRLADVDPLSPVGWVTVLSAALVALGIGSVAISLAIAAMEGVRPGGWLRAVTGVGICFVGLATAVGLLSGMVLRDTPSAWLLLLAGAGALAYGLRCHTELRQRHQRLEGAYSFTTDAVAALELGEDRTALLGRACDLLRAGWAELAFLADDGEPVVLENHDGVVRTTTGPAAAEVLERRLEQLANRTGAVLDDAVIVALPDTARSRGTFLVADRLGSLDRFGEGDLRLLETIAAQAAVVLRNRALVDRLRREYAERERQALHDALTQLPNRLLFDAELQRRLVDRGDRAIAVLLVDLDRFKDVNDTLGHQQGDRLLAEVAGRLRAAVPPAGFVARLAGDEFALILEDDADLDHVTATAWGLLEALAEPFIIDELPIDVGASVGIAACPRHADDAKTLLQRADVAMYAAKGRASGVALYDAADDRTSRERLALVAELRTAIERRELRVEFQPLVDLRTGRPVGAEALCRWHHPTRGLVAPDQFIPLAEASGLIRPLTELVLSVALRELRLWHDAGHRIGVSVNVSMRNLLDDTLPDTVARLLAESGVLASAVTLEVTESSFMAEPRKAISVLNRLSAMGLRLSIDDFGTGYSSLAQLHELPVDEVKVDRSFVRDLTSRRRDVAIVQAVVDLARALDLEVTAEGIEDGPAMQLLAGLGCHYGQGYHVSRPMTPALFHRWLQRQREEHASLTALLDAPPSPAAPHPHPHLLP